MINIIIIKQFIKHGFNIIIIKQFIKHGYVKIYKNNDKVTLIVVIIPIRVKY